MGEHTGQYWETVFSANLERSQLGPLWESEKKLLFCQPVLKILKHGRTQGKLPTWLKASLARCGNFADLYWKTLDKHVKALKNSTREDTMRTVLEEAIWDRCVIAILQRLKTQKQTTNLTVGLDWVGVNCGYWNPVWIIHPHGGQLGPVERI